MSVQSTYSAPTATVGSRSRPQPPSRSGSTWLAIVTLLVLVLVTAAAGTWCWVNFAGGQRDGAAVRRMVTAERAYWQGKTPSSGSAVETKKKKKKGAAKPGAGKTGAASDLATEGIVPVTQLQGGYNLASLKADNQRLRERLGSFFPSDIYIIVDTANNHLYLKKGQGVLLDATCSTGSYSQLTGPDGRSWFFHTPRGLFKVQRKIKNPIWVRPDWDYVEQGVPIPGARHESRYEPYVMGDYALAFGNGYYIHGTLYRRLLGQSVTHGCIRLGDQELETVFNTAPIGAPIFIY